VTPTVTRDAEGTVTGNTYDKYGSSNPVVKRLMAGFERTLDELWAKASPRSVLDVGCGEGVLTSKWAARLRDGRVVGIDLEDPPGHLNHWSRRAFVALLSRHGEVQEVRSPFPWTMLLARV
jgi:2-polyprenyl-3-methyl-5-hydroxy-6-metoxy-1,4-benzoquinol methylase